MFFAFLIGYAERHHKTLGARPNSGETNKVMFNSLSRKSNWIVIADRSLPVMKK
jgi:hypothetical protein